jgi:protein-disulfide isomerase
MPRKSSHTAPKVAPAVMPIRTAVATMPAAPYSVQSMVRLVSNNAGLIFIALSIFIVGFLIGSVWTENTMLKKGIANGTLGTQTAQNQKNQQPTGSGQPEASPVPLTDDQWQKVQQDPAGVIGNRNAPLTIVEYTDYQCPFCSRHYTQTYPQIKKDWLDTGKAKLILQDQPLTIHPNSKIASLAARCAGDQGFLGAKDKNFLYMHDSLFGKQDEWSSLSNTDAVKKFGDYANAGGMNGNQLMDCINTGKFTKQIDASIALGSSVGAGATPSFFVQKNIIVGAQDYSAFKTLLDSAK